jgi:hypothetical protein
MNMKCFLPLFLSAFALSTFSDPASPGEDTVRGQPVPHPAFPFRVIAYETNLISAHASSPSGTAIIPCTLSPKIQTSPDNELREE